MTLNSRDNLITKALRRLRDDIRDSEPPRDYFEEESDGDIAVHYFQNTISNPNWSTSTTHASSSCSTSWVTSSAVATYNVGFGSSYTHSPLPAPAAPDPQVVSLKPELTIMCTYCNSAASRPDDLRCSQCGAPLPIRDQWGRRDDDQFREHLMQLIDDIMAVGEGEIDGTS